MAWRPRSPMLFAAGCALLAFLVASILPVWVVWHLNEWEGVGEPGTFWGAVFLLVSNNIRLAGGPAPVVSLHFNNLILLAVVLALGFGAGRLFYWLRWQRRPIPAAQSTPPCPPHTERHG
jgi:hypothetical protein